jgi:hypothetical protein
MNTCCVNSKPVYMNCRLIKRLCFGFVLSLGEGKMTNCQLIPVSIRKQERRNEQRIRRGVG